MSKVYYIWGPKYIGGELNGPDLVAGVTLTEGRLSFTGRAPHLMLMSMSIEDIQKLSPEESEILFHDIVAREIPAGLQVVYSNASKEESVGIIQSLQTDALID